MSMDAHELSRLLPEWWWFRDGHYVSGENVTVNGTLIAKTPISRDAISCTVDGSPTDFLLTRAPEASRSRFWYLRDDCINGI